MSLGKVESLIAAADRKQRADFGEVMKRMLGALAAQQLRINELRADLDRLYPWRKVVFAADCDDDGNCPVCGTDFAECPCPGPTMEGYDYRTIDGELYGRKLAE